MRNILVTCAGSGIGQSAIDSLNLVGGFKVFGCDMNRNVYANNFCGDFFIVPSLYSEEYVQFILDLCIENCIDVVIPGHDHELTLLSKNIEKFKSENVEIIVSKPDLIDISRDKYEWFKYFNKFGCPIVPTFRVKEFKKNPDTSILPAIIKPAAGSSSQGIQIINRVEELVYANEADIIQPYLFPKKNDPNYNIITQKVSDGTFTQLSEVSIQLIFNRKSELAGIFISKNTLRAGVPVFIDPVIPEEFEYYDDIMKFVPVCLNHKVTGPVNIQGRITDKGLLCFEMNMRFTGITGNRAQLGFNEVAYLVNDSLGLPAALNGYCNNKLGVREVACTTIPRKNTNKKTYTILGAGGYIGTQYVSNLVKEGGTQQVNIVCRPSSYEHYLSKLKENNVKIVSADDNRLATLLCQSDVLINFVGALAFEDDLKKFDVIMFLNRIVKYIIKANIPVIINASSQSLYDQKSDIAKDESEKIFVNNSYAFQKYMTEELFSNIEHFCPSSQVISLRLARVVGSIDSNIKPSGFYVNVIRALKSREVVNIPYPKNKTNLVDIRDVISAINYMVNISEIKKDLPSIINVGGQNASLQQYCDSVLHILDADKDLVHYSSSHEVIESSMVDTGLLRSLGWSNNNTLDDTIRKLSNILDC